MPVSPRVPFIRQLMGDIGDGPIPDATLSQLVEYRATTNSDGERVVSDIEVAIDALSLLSAVHPDQFPERARRVLQLRELLGVWRARNPAAFIHSVDDDSELELSGYDLGVLAAAAAGLLMLRANPNGRDVDWSNDNGQTWTTLFAIPTSVPGPDGPRGAPGADGEPGWSPLVSVVSQDNARYLYVTSWYNPDADAVRPDTLRQGYLTMTGISDDIADAVNLGGGSGVDGLLTSFGNYAPVDAVGGTGSNPNVIARWGQWWYVHSDGSAVDVYMNVGQAREGGTWSQIVSIPLTGTGGTDGLTQAQVDARVRSIVEDWAEDGNAALIPIAKIPSLNGRIDDRLSTQIISQARQGNTVAWAVSKIVSAGRNAGRWLRIASDGNSIEGFDAPTWMDDPATHRIPGGNLGADHANDTFLGTVGNVVRWRTFAQIVTAIKGTLYAALAADSDEITVDGSNHLTVTAATPTAQALLDRFKADQVEIDSGDNTKLNITIEGGGDGEAHPGVTRVLNLQNLSANRQSGQQVESFQLAAVRQGEQIRFVALFFITTAGAANADLGPHRLSLNQTAPLTTTSVGYVEDRDFIRTGTPLDPATVGTYAVDGPEMVSFVTGQSITAYLHRGQDLSADADVRYTLQVYALRYGAQGVAGISDYDDLTDKPFLNEDPHTSTNTEKLLVWNEGVTPTIYQPHTTPATNPSFTDAEYSAADDLPAGATLGAAVDNFADLPQGAGDEFRFVRNEVRVYRWNNTDQVWRDYNEDIFATLGGERWFRTKAIAAAALGAHYHSDSAANGVHICYGSPRVLYVVVSFTAGTARETVHRPYGYEVSKRVDVNSGRIDHVETDILAGKSIWTGTEAEYTALADKDDNTLYFQTA